MSFSYPTDKNKPLPRVSIDQVSDDENAGLDTKPGWRPWTFSTTVLMSAIFFTAGLVILIGLLQWQQFRHGALFAVSTTDDFSDMQIFLNRYLPTVIIVLYGMAWSWIDLDVKRLEPWYQLAGLDGAAAEQSLLLHYPLDFLPFVPFKAAKRKQWAVVSASSIMVVVVWAVTPLQNGIFSNTLLSRSNSVSLHMSPGLVALSQQNLALGISMLEQTYSTTWLGQQLLPFTTRDYALQRFQPANDVGPNGSNMTISASTLLYGADLRCEPPRNTSSDIFGASLDDGKGCNAQGVIPIADFENSTDFMSYFIGYFNDAHTDTSLQIAGCDVRAKHTFLAIWKRSSKFAPNFSDPSNATALFCTPSYYQQQVKAQILMPAGEVVSVEPTGTATPLSEDIFNMTRFEYTLVNGAPPDLTTSPEADRETNRLDIVDATTLHQDSQLTNMSLVIPAPNMIGFAIGATHLEASAYSNPEEFTHALQKAYRLAFANAVSSVMAPVNGATLATGTMNGVFQTVSLVPVFSILSQVFLLIIVACTSWLLYLMQNRTSQLSQDPDSLAQIMSLAENPGLRRVFSQCGSLSLEQFGNALKPYRFDLIRSADQRPSIHCNRLDQTPGTVNTEKSTLSTRPSWEPAKPVTPFEYSTATKIGICGCLALLVAGLMVLRQQIHRTGGLPLPSSNTAVQQILINFIPTSIATVLEPLFVLLSRLACMMRPLEELRQGSVSAKTSLLTRYTSLPPQLVVLRALRDRKFVLAALCFLALLANLLTVAFSGLLSINEVLHAENTSLETLFQAKLPFVPINSSYSTFFLSIYAQNDAFYVADSNFSHDTQLPSWTTPHYYVPPLRLEKDTSVAAGNSEWRMDIRGYGADLDCQELTKGDSEAAYELDFGLDARYLRVLVKYRQDDGSDLFCKPSTSTTNATGTSTVLSGSNYTRLHGDPSNRKALEISASMVSLGSLNYGDIKDPCNQYMFQGWIRVRNGTVETSSLNDATFPQPQGLTSTLISCKAQVKTAILGLTVSSSGSVIAATPVSPDQSELSGNLEVALNETRTNFNVASASTWHTDTVAGDWPNYLISKYTKNRDLLNVTLPPPLSSTAINLTSELFSRLFAIQMSLFSAQLLSAAEGSPPVAAQVLTSQRRIFMSENLFWISLVILSLDLLVLVCFYAGLPPAFLPRMPISIASQIAYFAGSHVIEDVQRAGGDLQELDRKGYRYGYGKYIGQDGWSHVGIERVPFVVGLDACVERKRRWWTFGLRRRRST